MDNPTQSQTQKLESIVNLESMIHRYVNDIGKLKEEIKEQKDMYDSIFEADAAYSTQIQKEEEVKKASTTIKQQLLKTPSAIETSEKLKGMKEEIKDLQTHLSDLLKQYQKASGSNQITREDGEIFEIVSSVKLVKKSSKFNP